MYACSLYTHRNYTVLLVVLLMCCCEHKEQEKSDQYFLNNYLSCGATLVTQRRHTFLVTSVVLQHICPFEKIQLPFLPFHTHRHHDGPLLVSVHLLGLIKTLVLNPMVDHDGQPFMQQAIALCAQIWPTNTGSSPMWYVILPTRLVSSSHTYSTTIATVTSKSV